MVAIFSCPDLHLSLIFSLTRPKAKLFCRFSMVLRFILWLKQIINLKPLKIAFSAHIGSFWGALNTPFYPYYKIYLREIFNYNIFFKVLRFVGISHQNYYRTFGRKGRKFLSEPFFGWLLVHVGQFMTKVNVEILILKVYMFKHDISRDNAFCLIQKCNELCWIVTLTFLVRVKIRLKKTPEKHEVRPWTFVVTVLYSILLSYFI